MKFFGRGKADANGKPSFPDIKEEKKLVSFEVLGPVEKLDKTRGYSDSNCLKSTIFRALISSCHQFLDYCRYYHHSKNLPKLGDNPTANIISVCRYAKTACMLDGLELIVLSEIDRIEYFESGKRVALCLDPDGYYSKEEILRNMGNMLRELGSLEPVTVHAPRV